jgi:hypothetical protein
MTALVAQPPEFGDFGQHLGQEFLPAKAGIDGHDQHYAAQMQHIFDLRQWRRGVEHDTRDFAEFANMRQGAVQMDRGARFAMDQQMIGAGLGEVVEVMLRLDDHQMDIDRLRGCPAHRFDDDRADRDVRHKAAVHHIDMDPIAAGMVGGAHLVGKPAEISRQYRRRDDNGAGHRDGPRLRGQGPPLPAAAPQQIVGAVGTGAAGRVEFERHRLVVGP